jgi:hypothetical protein
MAELEEHPDPVEVGGDRGKGMLRPLGQKPRHVAPPVAGRCVALGATPGAAVSVKLRTGDWEAMVWRRIWGKIGRVEYADVE